jgi:hypothetical protein
MLELSLLLLLPVNGSVTLLKNISIRNTVSENMPEVLLLLLPVNGSVYTVKKHLNQEYSVRKYA